MTAVLADIETDKYAEKEVRKAAAVEKENEKRIRQSEIVLDGNHYVGRQYLLDRLVLLVLVLCHNELLDQTKLLLEERSGGAKKQSHGDLLCLMRVLREKNEQNHDYSSSGHLEHSRRWGCSWGIQPRSGVE